MRAFLRPDNGDRARGEVPLVRLDMLPSLDLLPTDSQVLIERYDELFGLLLSRDCPPYETEYCPQTFSVYRSHQLADIAGFYHAFGLEPSRTNPERADHVALELEFMSWLILKDEHARDSGSHDRTHAQVCRDAQQRFLADHLLWWTPAFAFAMRQKTDGISEESELSSPPESFYGATAQLLAAFMRAERLYFGIPPPQRLITPNPSDERPESTACEGCELLAQ
ncbi:MAG: molecular chaperone TorD family protein [candidate division Zixibacteria bacterium]|nr:molecular chaperone TorD family protein [candidate division Zixibacteria bacterium]